jgi:hypothetical protein
LSNCVPFQAGDFGFTVDCVAQCENILSIDQAQRDLATGPMGSLDETAHCWVCNTRQLGVRS